MKLQSSFKESCEKFASVLRPRFSSRMNVVGLSVGLTAGLMASASGHEVVGLLVACLATVGMVLAASKQRDQLLRFALCLAILVRMTLAISGQYLVVLPDSDVDAVKFEETGWRIASVWLGQETALSLSGWQFYSALIGLCYVMFGRVPLIPVVANVCFGVLTVLIVYRIAVLIGASRRSAGIAAFAMSVFPTANLYSAVLMRESILVLLFSLSVLFFFKWLTTGIMSHALMAIVFLVPACVLHNGLLFVGAAYCPFFFFYRPKTRRWTVFTSGAVTGLILVAIAMSLARGSLIRELPSVISAEYLRGSLSYATRGRAAYLVNLMPSSMLDVFLQTPIRVVYLLFAPFPWDVRTTGDVVAAIDALLYLALILEILRVMRRRQWKGPIWLASLAILCLFLVTFAWGTSNFGTGVRHRHKIAWLLVVLASPGLASRPWFAWVFPSGCCRGVPSTPVSVRTIHGNEHQVQSREV
jgi:hypothetical protein